MTTGNVTYHTLFLETGRAWIVKKIVRWLTKGPTFHRRTSLQAKDVDPILVQCWASNGLTPLAYRDVAHFYLALEDKVCLLPVPDAYSLWWSSDRLLENDKAIARAIDSTLASGTLRTGRPNPANTKHLYNIYTMLDQRRRRCADVV